MKKTSVKTYSIMLSCTAVLLMTLTACADTHGAGIKINSSVDASQLKSKKQSSLGLYLTAQEAYDLASSKADDVLFVDVRAPAELEFVGWTPLIDKNIPWQGVDFNNWDLIKKRYKRVPNKNFVQMIDSEIDAKKLDKESPVVLICRSGVRTAKAASLLAKSGYSNVYTIIEGFEGDKGKEGDGKGKRVVNGWKNSGLPWTYSLDKSKLHQP